MSSRPSYFPIFLDLADELCTVVGGGDVAARKVRSLLDCGARVRVVAPELCRELEALLAGPGVEHVGREYQHGDLAGSTLVFAATNERQVNEAVHRDARREGILVNVVDDPRHCAFIVPSSIDRRPIQVAISTGGTSPALARHLRERLEQAVPEEYAAFAELLGRLRPQVMAGGQSPREREALWRKVVESDVLALLRDGKPLEAEARARQLLGIGAEKEKRRGNSRTIVIGTRGSALALAQAEWVAARLEECGAAAQIQVIRTTGDVVRGSLDRSGVGVFVREIEQALLRQEADLAVHSMKDLPIGVRAGLATAAVPVREDPCDAVVSRSGAALADLPSGSRVATSSPRRVAQLRAHLPHLEFVDVRGNVDTRLRKLSDGQFEALVLAYAGLVRLGRSEVVAERIPTDLCLPAPGQGALAVQIREGDDVLRDLLAQLDHRPSRLAVEAERACLGRLGAGCSVPVGVLGVLDGDDIVLRGAVADREGRQVVRGERRGPADAAEDLGVGLAEELLAAGADRILAGGSR